MEGNGDADMEELGRCLSSYVDEGSIDSHRYYLSRRTVLEMLRDRGYSIPSSEIDLSLSDFRAIHGESPDVERLRFSATHASDPSKRVTISFHAFAFAFLNLGIPLFLLIVVSPSFTHLVQFELTKPGGTYLVHIYSNLCLAGLLVSKLQNIQTLNCPVLCNACVSNCRFWSFSVGLVL